MKKAIILMLVGFLALSSDAQTNIPQLVSFSAVVRDTDNQPLVNTAVSIRLTFKEGGQDGPLVYCALHQTTTNQNGFMSLQLNRDVLGTGCNGAPSTAFENIPWENGDFWMEVEYQTVPGSPFINLGQLELASSFYAFAAGTAERIAGFDLSGAEDGDVLTYNISTQQWEAMSPTGGSNFSGDYNDLTNTPDIPIVPTNVSAFTNDAGYVTSSFSGDYNDLTNAPEIPSVPTNVSAFANDAGYLTSSFSGDYNDLTNTPDIPIVPTNVSAFTNDAGYVTSSFSGDYNDLVNTPDIPNVPTNVSAFANDAGYIADYQELSVSEIGDTLHLQNGGFVIIPGISLANSPAQLATVLTTDINNISDVSATAGGNVLNDGGSTVTERGICWGLNQTPTTANNVTIAGGGTGNFTTEITGLSESTTYYVRAYATNGVGTAYGNEVSFTSAEAGIVTNPGAGVTFNGYTYSSIVLGNGQEWMAENLRTAVYANGDPIPNVTDNTEWSNLTTGAWSHYNNDSQYEIPYGKLYIWHTVVDPRNVCPTGWHVPTFAEWTVLTDYLGTVWVAGGKMKSVGTDFWESPNTEATNESGFSGLPGGSRTVYGPFSGIGFEGYWWTSTESNGGSNLNMAAYRGMYYDTGSVDSSEEFQEAGFSVRCLKD